MERFINVQKGVSFDERDSSISIDSSVFIKTLPLLFNTI